MLRLVLLEASQMFNVLFDSLRKLVKMIFNRETRVVILLVSFSYSYCTAIEIDHCACQKINLICSEQLLKSRCTGAEAGGCSTRCDIYLTEATCRTKGLQTGITSFQQIKELLSVNLDKIKRSIFAQKVSSINMYNFFQRYIDHLTFIHEMYHVCTTEDYSVNGNLALEESLAYDAVLQEVNSTITEVCQFAPDVFLNNQSVGFCRDLCYHGYHFDLLLNWHRCLISDKNIGNNNWLSTKDCKRLISCVSTDDQIISNF